jgi:hypothetical protein
MELKRQIKFFLLGSIVLFGVSMVVGNSTAFGLCAVNHGDCIRLLNGDIGQFLFFFSLISFIFLILLYFLPPSIFKAWKKFVYWFVPLSVVLIALVPSDGSGAFMPGPDREIAIWLFASLYALIGMLLIAVKWIRVHSKNKA